MPTCQLVNSSSAEKPTLGIIAQQLRSDMVFEAWLKAFHNFFKVWRIPDDLLIDGLKEGSGFVVHAGILRRGAQYHWPEFVEMSLSLGEADINHDRWRLEHQA